MNIIVILVCTLFFLFFKIHFYVGDEVIVKEISQGDTKYYDKNMYQEKLLVDADALLISSRNYFCFNLLEFHVA